MDLNIMVNYFAKRIQVYGDCFIARIQLYFMAN